MVGEEVGNELALAEFLELGEVSLDLELLSLQLGDRLSLCEGLRHGLSVELIELGLVVEGLQVGRAACHGEENDPLDFGIMVREAGESVVGGIDRASEGIAPKQGKKGRGAEADAGRAEEGAPVEMISQLFGGGHRSGGGSGSRFRYLRSSSCYRFRRGSEWLVPRWSSSLARWHRYPWAGEPVRSKSVFWQPRDRL